MKQVSTSIMKATGEVNDLQLWKGPGQLFVIARSKQKRSNASFESILLKSVQKFSLHPSGMHGIRRKNDDKPIAALQRSADLVVPLLGTLDVGNAVLHLDPMASQNTD